MTLNNLFGYNTLGRLIRFAPADVLAWLFPGGSSTTSDFNVRDLTANRDFHVGNIFSVLSETGVTHAQQLSVFGSPNGGRAQVEVQTVDGFQTTALQNWRDHDGDVICSVMPGGFAGPAPGITAVPAASLTGTVANARLDSKLAAFAASSVVFASQVGTADFQPASSTGTDNYTVFRDALVGGRKVLVVDGGWYGLSQQLRLESETKILFLSGCGFGKLAANDGKSLVTNAHPVPYGVAPIDAQIEVYGGGSDGSRRNGGAGPGALGIGTNAAGEIVPTILLAGVLDPIIQDHEVFDSCTYAAFLINCVGGRVTRFRHRMNPGDTNLGLALLGIESGTRGLLVEGCGGSVTDDFIALECGGWQHQLDTPPGNVLYPDHLNTVPQFGAPVTDITIRDCHADSALTLMRFLSPTDAASITDVRVNGISGYVKSNGFFFDQYFTGAGTTQGRYDRIFVDNAEVYDGGALDVNADTGGIYVQRANLGVVEFSNLWVDHPRHAVRCIPAAAPLSDVPRSALTVRNLGWGGGGSLPVVLNAGTLPVRVAGDIRTKTATSGNVTTADGTTLPAGSILCHVGSQTFAEGEFDTSATPNGVPVFVVASGLTLGKISPIAPGGSDAIGCPALTTVTVNVGSVQRMVGTIHTGITLSGQMRAGRFMAGAGSGTVSTVTSDGVVGVSGASNPAFLLQHLVSGKRYAFLIGSDNALYLFDDSRGAPLLIFDTAGHLSLPSVGADPHVAGALWSNAGVLTVSAG